MFNPSWPETVAEITTSSDYLRASKFLLTHTRDHDDWVSTRQIVRRGPDQSSIDRKKALLRLLQSITVLPHVVAHIVAEYALIPARYMLNLLTHATRPLCDHKSKSEESMQTWINSERKQSLRLVFQQTTRKPLWDQVFDCMSLEVVNEWNRLTGQNSVAFYIHF